MYYYTPTPLASGKFEISAKVEYWNNEGTATYNPQAKAGLMIRSGPGDSAVNVFLGVTKSNGIVFQVRNVPGGNTITTKTIPGYTAGNTWVMIRRIDQMLFGYVRNTGTAFTLVDSMQIGPSLTSAGFAYSCNDPTPWTSPATTRGIGLKEMKIQTYAPPLPVRPFLDYVNIVGGDTTAYFGYDNPNNFDVVIDTSGDNRFSYKGNERFRCPHPTTFSPGRHNGAVAFKFDGSPVIWYLGDSTATATMSGTVNRLAIMPMLGGVTDNCDGTLTASFGYYSPHTIPIFKNALVANSLNSCSYAGGFPFFTKVPLSNFDPGMHTNAFNITFPVGALTWRIDTSAVTGTEDLATNTCKEFQFYKAFAFGADTTSFTVANAPGSRYIKIAQGAGNIGYDSMRGYGYTDFTNIDPSVNNRNVFSGSEELYDQFIAVKALAGMNRDTTRFKVNAPDGMYRIVLSGGDASARTGGGLITVSGSMTSTTYSGYGLSSHKQNLDSMPQGTFYSIGFRGRNPPVGDGSIPDPVFMPTTSSMWITALIGEITVNQTAYTDSGAPICLLELWYLPRPQSIFSSYSINEGEQYTLYDGFNLNGSNYIEGSDPTAKVILSNNAKPAPGTSAVAIYRLNGSLKGVYPTIEWALNSTTAGEGERIVVLRGSYNQTDSLTAPIANLTMSIDSGTTITLPNTKSSVYMGRTGRITGIDQATLTPRIILYDSLGTTLGIFGSIAMASRYAETKDRILINGVPLDINKTVKWAMPFNTAPGSFGMPALSEDGKTVFFGAQDSCLYAVNADSGRLKWKFSLGNRITGSPSIAGNQLFVGTVNNIGGRPEETRANFMSFDISPGLTNPEERIYYNMPLGVTGTPAIDKTNKLVIFGALNDTIYAFPYAGDAREWKFATAQQCYPWEWSNGTICVDGLPTSVAISDGYVYAATKAGDLYKINALTGVAEFRKSLAPGAGNCGSPTIDNNVVYLDMAYSEWEAPETEKYLYRVTSAGVIMDSTRHNGFYNQDPGVVVHSGKVYTTHGSDAYQKDDTIVELQRDSNNTGMVETWSYTYPGLKVETSMVIGKDSCLYVPTANGMLLKLKIGGPASAHRYIPLPARCANSPIMGPDGTVYVLCYNSTSSRDTSYLVAIATNSPGMVSSWPSGHGDAQNSGYVPENAPPDLAYKGVGSVAGASYQWNQDNTLFTMCGAGTDIWDRSDGFEYAYEYMAGDFEVITKVASLDNTNGWAKAGIMVRATLLNNAVHGSILVSASEGAAFQYRQTIADVTQNIGIAGYCPGSTWLKAKRIDGTLFGFVSRDGASWVQVGSMQIGAGGVFAGLAHTSHNAYQSGCASFSSTHFEFLVKNSLTSWPFTAKLKFNTTPTGANVTQSVQNIPMLVRLTASNFNFSEARPDGGDIRFYDPDMTPLPYEIDSWDATGRTAAIWVRVPQVDGNSSQDYITMYWGNPLALSESNGAAVFSNGYNGVWHLQEDRGGTGSSGVYKDASGNQRSGKDMVSACGKGGVIGKGQQFSKMQGDRIEMSSLSGTTSAFTLAAWVNTDRVYADQDASNGDQRQKTIFGNFNWWPGGGYGMQTFGTQLVGTVSVPGNKWYYQTGVLQAQQWMHLAVSWSAGDSIRFYRDGMLVGKTKSDAGTSAGTTLPTTISCSDVNRAFDGYVDEVQQSGTVRGAAWVKLSYENQKPGQTMVTLERGTYPQWQRNRTVNLNTTASGAWVTGNVTGFPVLVRLTSANFTFSQAQAGGQDIRFTKGDGITPLPYEISRWDNAGQVAEIWVKLDTVYGNNSTQSVKMFWGNAQAQSESNGATVFSATGGFAGVWHLEEERAGTGTNSVYLDASSNRRNGKDMVSACGKSGVMGKGQQFNKWQGDYIEIPSLGTATSALTYSAWVNPDTVYAITDTGNGDQRQKVIVGDFSWWPGGGTQMHSLGSQLVGLTAVPGNQWYYQDGIMQQKTWTNIAITWQAGDSLRFFKNGSCVGAVKTDPGQAAQAIRALTISSPTVQTAFDGSIDEVRQESMVRSKDWIKLAYQNQRVGQVLVEFR